MWKIEPDDVIDLSFASMEPHEVLYEFDSSVIFTFYLASKLFFAYFSDEDCVLQTTRYLVVATDENEIKSLKLGVVTINKVLDKSIVWAVDRDFNGNLVSVNCLANGMKAVPNSHKPRPNTLLYAHLKYKAVPVEREKIHRSISNSNMLTAYQGDLMLSDIESSVSSARNSRWTTANEHPRSGMDRLRDKFSRAALEAGFASARHAKDLQEALVGAWTMVQFEESLHRVRANSASIEAMKVYMSSKLPEGRTQSRELI